MLTGPVVKHRRGLLRLRLGDHLTSAFGEGEPATLPSAVALMRTLFEDHYVDPEHQSCRFFHGCTIMGSQGQLQDFTVIHRDGRVILSEFTGPSKGPQIVSLPLEAYAQEVVRFAASVLANPPNTRYQPEWQQRLAEAQLAHLQELVALGQRLLASRCTNHPACCAQFAESHALLKRPLELLVLEADRETKPFHPVDIVARLLFGPVKVGELIPLRLNRGDLLRATVTHFTPAGVHLHLEALGSGGIRPGDRLFGLQLFYP